MKLFVLGKKFFNIYSKYFWTPVNKISLKLNGVKFQKGLSVRGKIYIYRHKTESSVEIGENFHANSAPWANPIGAGERIFIQMVDAGKLKIGNNVGISNSAITCSNEVTIENNVLIGAGCKIYDTDFHPLEYTERMKPYSPDLDIKTAPIRIGEGAFLGAGCTILKGVTIGKHSIVGAGSVVAKDIPENEIWAGNPAKFIKKVN